MVGWHHRLNGHEFEEALGVGDGKGGLHAAAHRVTKVGHNLVTEQQQEYRFSLKLKAWTR